MKIVGFFTPPQKACQKSFGKRVIYNALGNRNLQMIFPNILGLDVREILGIVCPNALIKQNRYQRWIMKELLRLTQLIYSCWIIADEKEGSRGSIPTGGGILGYALRDAVNQGAFPDWARKQLHFVNGETGLACLELPFIEKLATEIKLTSDPNPSYTRTNIAVGRPVALRCLSKLDIPQDKAASWGRILHAAAGSAEAKLQAQKAA